MAELLRTHPLEAWSGAFAALPSSVGITMEPYVAMVDVRLGAVDSMASARLGVDLPTVPNTWRFASHTSTISGLADPRRCGPRSSG